MKRPVTNALPEAVTIHRRPANDGVARSSRVALAILTIIVLMVLVGPELSPHNSRDINPDLALSPPSLSNGHWFGTDDLGRDLYTRTLEGGRMSLAVGVIATFISLLIGVVWGATAGFLGGRIDHLMMRIVDALYAMPFLFLVIMLMVFFGQNFLLFFLAIGAINWLDMARIVRGQTLTLRRQSFVEAAMVTGLSSAAIIRRHIVPNVLGVVAVYATLTVPQVILFESFLSFLGLGVQEPMTSWGALVNEGSRQMETAPAALLIPGGLLAATLYSLNYLGDGFRDLLDPRAQH